MICFLTIYFFPHLNVLYYNFFRLGKYNLKIVPLMTKEQSSIAFFYEHFSQFQCFNMAPFHKTSSNHTKKYPTHMQR